MDYKAEQIKVCEMYSANFFESREDLKIGISLNVKSGLTPLNGLRHNPENGTTGWYIWAGEEFSTDTDFFVPLHVSHLKDWSSDIVKFLGLPPGYRFLKAGDYEDVWFDEELLKI